VGIVAADIVVGDIAAMDTQGAVPVAAADIVAVEIVAWDTPGAAPVVGADIVVVGIAGTDIAGDTPAAALVQKQKRLPTLSRRPPPLGHFSFSASLSPPMSMTMTRAVWFPVRDSRRC
jgi:hypothetical protein